MDNNSVHTPMVVDTGTFFTPVEPSTTVTAFHTFVSQLPAGIQSLDGQATHDMLTHLQREAPLVAENGYHRKEHVERFVVSLMNMFFGCLVGTQASKVAIVVRGSQGYNLCEIRQWRDRLSHMTLRMPLLSRPSGKRKAIFVVSDEELLVTTTWEKSPHRRVFHSISILPKPIASHVCLFQGYSGLQGSCAHLDDSTLLSLVQPLTFFLSEHWGRRDASTYAFAVRFFASVIQRPLEKIPVPVIYKSTACTLRNDPFLEKLLSLFGPNHFVHASREEVAGRYNGQLRSSVIVALDNFVFKSTDLPKLHSMIKEQQWSVTEKGLPVTIQETPRFTIIRPSGELPVLSSCFVVDVLPPSAELVASIKSIPLEAIVEAFRRVPLEGFQASAVPMNKELSLMQISTLDPVHRWWHQCLVHSKVVPKDLAFGEEIANSVLFQCFKDWNKNVTKSNSTKRKKVANEDHFWQELALVCRFEPVVVQGIPCQRLPSIELARSAWQSIHPSIAIIS